MYMLYIYTCSSTLRGVDQSNTKLVPCFTADVVLSLPNIVSIHVHVHVAVF